MILGFLLAALDGVEEMPHTRFAFFVLVLWVWADREATANPKTARMPRSENNSVFIINAGLNFCEPTHKNRCMPLQRMWKRIA